MNLPELFSALADPTRLKVLEMLHQKSRPVHELAAAFDISRPAISRHLRVLKEAGLVAEVKQGRENVYSFQRAVLGSGSKWIEVHGTAAKARKKAPATAEASAAIAKKPRSTIVVKSNPAVPKKPARAPSVEVKPMAKPAAPAPTPQLSFFDF